MDLIGPDLIRPAVGLGIRPVRLVENEEHFNTSQGPFSRLTTADTMRWIGPVDRVRVGSWALSGHGDFAVDCVG